MVLNAGHLNRRIQIQRATSTRDSFGGTEREWRDYGPTISARRQDLSDSARVIAGLLGNKLVTRFTIRATTFARGISRSDRLVHEGLTFEIDGIKEVSGHRRFIEITAKSDQVQ
ncbi:head-tail adaptor protein [Thalassovita sp.]|uniref:head-tail adaptor protein n=1 Tax=Thalassovita sp. TaxID=1979401 RepID=UPI002AB0408C|nr:head-tail adaptor protein [Thalassovita sp.]